MSFSLRQGASAGGRKGNEGTERKSPKLAERRRRRKSSIYVLCKQCFHPEGPRR